MATRIQLRRDTAANWAEANPALAMGEAGFDVTNNQLRIGDGERNWNALTPLDGSNIDLSIYATQSALNSETATRAAADLQHTEDIEGLQLQIDAINEGGPGPGTVLNWDYEGTGYFVAPTTGGIKLHPDGIAIYISKTNAAGDDIEQEILNEMIAGNLFSLQVPARTAGDTGDPNQYQQFSIQQNPVSQGDWFNVATSRIIDANATQPWQAGSTSLDMVVQMAPQTRFLLTDPEEQPEDIITDPELLQHWLDYKEEQGWEADYIPTQQDVNRYFNDVDQVQQVSLRDMASRLDALESGGGPGGGGPDGPIALTYRGTPYWPSTLAQGDAMAHPDDATLFLPTLDLNGFDLETFLDEFVKAGTTFLITEVADKNRWVHFEATGSPQKQNWGRNIPTNRIGGKFAIRDDREVSMVIDLAHAGTFDQARWEGVEEMLAAMKKQISSLKGEITKLKKANG